MTKRRTFHQSASTSSLASATSTGTSAVTSQTQADKYGILSPVFKHLSASSAASAAGYLTADMQNMTMEQQFKSLVEPAVTTETFESLPEDLLTQEIKLNSSNFNYP